MICKNNHHFLIWYVHECCCMLLLASLNSLLSRFTFVWRIQFFWHSIVQMQLDCQSLRNALPAALGLISPLHWCKHYCLPYLFCCFCLLLPCYLIIQIWCPGSSVMALHGNIIGFSINYSLYHDYNVPKMFMPYVPVLDAT